MSISVLYELYGLSVGDSRCRNKVKKNRVEFPKRRTDEKKTETKTAEKTEDNFQNFGFS